MPERGSVGDFWHCTIDYRVRDFHPPSLANPDTHLHRRSNLPSHAIGNDLWYRRKA